MKFRCMIWPHSGTTIEPVVRLAKTAEECGFETVYIGDSQMIRNDVWVTLTACALATGRVRLGTGVTNTVTRHGGRPAPGGAGRGTEVRRGG